MISQENGQEAGKAKSPSNSSKRAPAPSPADDLDASGGKRARMDVTNGFVDPVRLDGEGIPPVAEFKQLQDERSAVAESAGAAANGECGVKSDTTFVRLVADVAEDRGSRHSMEDTWVMLPDAWQGAASSFRCAHFAIFDGHGGRNAAEYARAHLHANVLSAGLPRELMDRKGVKRAIITGFKTTDEALLAESASGKWLDGATAVCVWVLGQTVFVANVGDAKAVLARTVSKSDGDTVADGTSANNLKGFVVTREHKAIYPQERARIVKAGGYVEANGRLLGRLEVSRAFGDRTFKKGVIVTPDVHVFELSEREQFLILGCDGLWGFLAHLTLSISYHLSLRTALLSRWPASALYVRP